MLIPNCYSLNSNPKPIYDYNQIIKEDGDNIEEWLNRDDIIIMDFKKPNEKDIENEFDYLNTLLTEIDNLEEKFKLS